MTVIDRETERRMSTVTIRPRQREERHERAKLL
jgi:hypothetical protein